MNARAAALLALMSGCSVLFDPSKVAVSGCPTSAERCSTPANARAICQAAACAFECFEGFRDADGVADNGCEASCAVLAAPTTLNVTSVTDGTSLSWAFAAVANATSYRLCTSVSAGTPTCITVSPTDCTAGLCRAQTTGHPLKAQVSGQVQAINACQAASPEARATGFTVRANEVLSWSSDSTCMPTATTSGEVLSVEQPPFCLGTATLGDQAFRSGTFEVELRPAGTLGGNVLGGFVFSSGTRREGVLLGSTTVPSNEGATLLREANNSVFWRLQATSGAVLVPDVWNRVRVVLKDDLWSISVGRSSEPLREVIRYRDEGITTEGWRIGLHSLTPALLFLSGRMEFRNLTLSTATELPAEGPKTQSWSFTTAGPQPSVREIGATNLRYEGCPGFPAAGACGAATSCTPDAGTCARLTRGGTWLTFDLPTGLDTQRGWHLHFRFAGAADGGFSNGTIASSAMGTLLEPENDWDGGVRGLGGRWGLSVRADTWNVVDFRFEPGDAGMAARLNGQNATLTGRFPPLFWDKHVGAVRIGSGAPVDLWLSDLSITQ
jgi:hypothetical protein